jgi:hypothetical protein
MGLWARAAAALGRVDYMLTYALVRFVDEVLATYFSAGDVLFVALVATALTCRADAPLGPTGASVRRVAAVLLANGVQTGLPSAFARETGDVMLVLHWLVATCAVVLLPTLLAPYTDEQVFAQVSRLVLFTYAENSAYITARLHLDYVLAAVAALALHAAEARAAVAGVAERTVLRALSMLATNVIVSSLLREDTGGLVEIAWLVGALILLDNVAASLAVASELRDYAVWRAAALIGARLEFFEAPADAVLGVVLGAVGLAYSAQCAAASAGFVLHYGAMLDLGVLVGANTALGVAERGVRALPPSLVWIALLGTVNVVHIALEAAAQSGSGSGRSTTMPLASARQSTVCV